MNKGGYAILCAYIIVYHIGIAKRKMKKFKQTKIFPVIIILFAFLFFIFISAISYVNAVFYNISDSVFRLHVIANSDSEEDQNLKYLVRDAILNYMNTITESATTKTEAIEIAKQHESDFYRVAQETIYNAGYDYSVNISFGNFYFPTKNYGDISLPAGSYDALKIEIGNASGQNWWCVMFPPLCFVDVTSGIVDSESKHLMEQNLSSEEYVIISEKDDADIKFKFKLIEFFKSL